LNPQSQWRKFLKKLKNKALYIGEGFINSQLLWLIPLVDGYCEKKKINRLVFDERISPSVLKNKIIKRILKKYEILYPSKLSLLFSNKYIYLFTYGFSSILKSIINSFLLKRNKIICHDWYETQIRHAVWDSAILHSEDGQIEPNLLKIFLAYMRCYRKIFFSNFLVKKLNIKYFFIAHSVYSSRAFLANLRKLNATVYCHSGFTIYKQPKNKDSSWCFIDKKQQKIIDKKISIKDIENYWSKRIRGRGNYEDSRIAAKIENNTYHKYENVLFLHIFRDSPFADIDPKRIFEDYIFWIKETLTIIKKSKEKWTIRLHPNYKRWGENQFLTINKIINDVFGENVPKNISIEDNLNSNNIIFKTAKRIITFNGTSHLEAAANKIKPIIISETMLSFVNKKLCYKPKTFKEYEKLLLCPPTTKNFSLNESNSLKARKLIFIREKILKFEKEIGGFHIYAKDTKKNFSIDFSNTEKKLQRNCNFLKKNGENLAKDIKISMSPKYINLIK
jgi:hypothetical protein